MWRGITARLQERNPTIIGVQSQCTLDDFMRTVQTQSIIVYATATAAAATTTTTTAAATTTATATTTSPFHRPLLFSSCFIAGFLHLDLCIEISSIGSSLWLHRCFRDHNAMALCTTVVILGCHRMWRTYGLNIWKFSSQHRQVQDCMSGFLGRSSKVLAPNKPEKTILNIEILSIFYIFCCHPHAPSTQKKGKFIEI